MPVPHQYQMPALLPYLPARAEYRARRKFLIGYTWTKVYANCIVDFLVAHMYAIEKISKGLLNFNIS